MPALVSISKNSSRSLFDGSMFSNVVDPGMIPPMPRPAIVQIRRKEKCLLSDRARDSAVIEKRAGKAITTDSVPACTACGRTR